MQAATAGKITTGLQKRAVFKFHPSATIPMTLGESASPNKWIINILTANAMERTGKGVVSTSAAAIAPVGKKSRQITNPKQLNAPPVVVAFNPSHIGKIHPSTDRSITL